MAAERRRGLVIVVVCSLVAVLSGGLAGFRPLKNWWDTRSYRGKAVCESGAPARRQLMKRSTRMRVLPVPAPASTRKVVSSSFIALRRFAWSRGSLTRRHLGPQDPRP